MSAPAWPAGWHGLLGRGNSWSATRGGVCDPKENSPTACATRGTLEHLRGVREPLALEGLGQDKNTRGSHTLLLGQVSALLLRLSTQVGNCLIRLCTNTPTVPLLGDNLAEVPTVIRRRHSAGGRTRWTPRMGFWSLCHESPPHQYQLHLIYPQRRPDDSSRYRFP